MSTTNAPATANVAPPEQAGGMSLSEMAHSPRLGWLRLVMRNKAAVASAVILLVFAIMGLLAPYVKPVIAAASNALKQGSGTVVHASAQQQYLVWSDPTSTDPTHSMLSKDHFSNILNSPAGNVATVILQYVAPRVIYGWDHPEVPEQEIMEDISRVFHHPTMREHNCEIHCNNAPKKTHPRVPQQ